MHSLPKISKVLGWSFSLGMVTLCLTFTASTLRGQFLQRLFHRDKPAPAAAPAPPPDTSDGGYLAKQRYDSLTRGTQHDQAKLLALVKPFVEKQFPPITGSAPKIPGAEMVDDDTLCATCHATYVKLHRTDIHRNQACEVCHGPASEHLKTRGTKPGTIVSFKTATPADQNEVCLKCHEQHVKDRFVGQQWRVSTHAHAGDACAACHKNHYTVPSGTPATQVGAAPAQLPPRAKETEAEVTAIRSTYAALGVPGPQTCYKCHGDNPGAPKEAPKICNMQVPGHPHQVDGPHNFKCTTCHDPHGVLRKEVRTDMCIQCHRQDPKTMPWCGSSHAKAGMACVDCHNPHSPLPKLGAAEPSTCYKCHTEKVQLEQVAHPHQINGVNGFKCVTCHNPHDNIRRATRVDTCLSCHKGHPTMAWQSSTHALQFVACADCHDPHPNSKVPLVVDIDHNQVNRAKRMPMSVDEPRVCYRCHQRIAGLFNLPFHHPVPEGKMLCSKCHDPHGSEGDKLLKQPTVNLTCYKCHSSKQGPFVYEHPPVTENCMICHNPHGTVAKELLKQPPTFLCLRCHSGHNGAHHVHLGQVPSQRAAFYTDCTQCHHEIHGSDLPGVGRNGSFFQR
ncbi:MAG TPA: cytochrome c3 family protein [Gemmataceae bacterium]|nr:cytochrome c3 family protein [Gemmataceae bacterium]